MRIVLSNASPSWGGVHGVTEILARGLRERGHEILVLCRPASRLERRIQDYVPTAGVLRGMDLSPGALWRVRSELRRFRPGVVLALTKKDVRLTAPVARMMGVPVVVRHANDRPLRDAAYHRWLYGRLPAHHIANSWATRSTLLGSAPWLPAGRVSVIHNGVDAAELAGAAPAELGLPTGALAVGFVGRMDERKGVLDLAEAWPRVAERAPEAHLLLVGTGPCEAEAKRRLRDEPRVHWLGYRSDIPAVMAALDVVAMPSHWEGFGLVAAEALAAGTPVVATRVSSLPEVVRDGQDGRLVPPRDPAALADALLEMLADRGLRERFGHSGVERVRREFSVAAMLDRYERLLEHLVDANREGSGPFRDVAGMGDDR